MAAKKQLVQYRTKRNFDKTSEPSGAEQIASVGRNRFVIHKHEARRLHYDLRLEVDGVFKSWAVTKGPSLKAGVKRLAVEVEDHPLDYGDFEGTIPAGEYGGGTVQIWDRGFWQMRHDGGSPRSALKKGHLEFVLAGEKLEGAWNLVLMHEAERATKRHNWLLIKIDDAFAVKDDTDRLLKQDKSVASGRSMSAIAKGKPAAVVPFLTAAAAKPPAPATKGPRKIAVESTRTPRAKASRAGHAEPSPRFLDIQLCRIVDRPPEGSDWVHEIKFDGYRVQLRVAGGKVTLRTRSGLDWTARFSALAAAAAKLPDCIMDGEVVALDNEGSPDFPALQAALSEGQTGALVYFAFDLLWDASGDLRSLGLIERKSRLEQMLGKSKKDALIRYVAHFAKGGEAVLRSACKLALEGIVSKKGSSPYREGRTGSWTKAKCRAGHEVVIGGWATTAGRFRSLLVGVFRDEHFVYVGRVGTGFGEAAVTRLEPRLRAARTSKCPFTGIGVPRSASNITWTRPTLVAEIEFAGWTGDGMVRQAAFKGLREDKPARQVQAERPHKSRPLRTSKALTSERKSPGTENGSTILGVKLSHPDKELWPAFQQRPAVNKRDLANYLVLAGEWMLPHIQGRPCSIVRVPDGLAGEQFFQRHAMPGTSSLIDLVTVKDDPKPYLEVNHQEGLVALAQIAALEIHPWNCVPGSPEVPGRLVFDLDPGPEVEFPTVVEGALELKVRLDALGLASFCKTTGGKGLHVVVPLVTSKRRPCDWETAKNFAHAVCLAMAQDNPAAYLVNMSKKRRTGRIFLDYLRNAHGATAVAPLSPRARPGAPISMPLIWRQVNKDLNPGDFSIETAPQYIRKTRAWRDYDEAGGDLKDAIRRITASPRSSKK